MRKDYMIQMEKKLEGWALMMGESLPVQWALYRCAKEDLKKGINKSDAIRQVYENEESRISNSLIHRAKIKLRARLRADLILSLLLLDDGCEDAAVDNILEAIQYTHRGRQIKIAALLNSEGEY